MHNLRRYQTGDTVSISWDETLQYMTLYHLFGVFWTTQFIAGFGMMAGGRDASMHVSRLDRAFALSVFESHSVFNLSVLNAAP